MFTDRQKEILELKAGHVEILASELWEANQKVEFDPMHPRWDSFCDPIKEEYRNAASLTVLANMNEAIVIDPFIYTDCISQLLSLLVGGYDPNNYYHSDIIKRANLMVRNK